MCLGSPDFHKMSVSVLLTCLIKVLVLLGSTSVHLAVVGQSVRDGQVNQTVSLLAYESVTFTCSPPTMASSSDCDYIHWRRRRNHYTPITYQYITACTSLYGDVDANRVSVEMSNTSYNLHIASVGRSDAGDYQCVTFYGSQQVIQNRVTLNVYYPECSINAHQPIQVGDDVSLVCSLPLNRLMQWRRGTVVAYRRASDPASPLMLNLTASEDDDFSRFGCHAESPNATSNPGCFVSPRKYTSVRLTPAISRVEAGDSVVFHCYARLGAPTPQQSNYTWLQDGVIVRRGVNITTYTVRDLQLSDNSTRIQCKASHVTRFRKTLDMESDETFVYVNDASTTSITAYTTTVLTTKYYEVSKRYRLS